MSSTPAPPSVEWLIATIKRATDQENSDWAYHPWDIEYAEDMLNEFLTGLGSKVTELRHDYSDFAQEVNFAQLEVGQRVRLHCWGNYVLEGAVTRLESDGRAVRIGESPYCLLRWQDEVLRVEVLS